MMERQPSLLGARGLLDNADCLLSADDALIELQERCGGSLKGTLAVPELLEIAQESRRMGLRVAREFSAFDGTDLISGFVSVHPLPQGDGGGCELLIENWQYRPLPQLNSNETARRLDEIDRASAEVSARLDAQQCILFFDATAPDTVELKAAVDAAPVSQWSEHVDLEGVAHQQPLHWRLLDGVRCTFAGSDRNWRVRLLPLGQSGGQPRGFDLLMVADEPLEREVDTSEQLAADQSQARLIGSALTPVLRQPIARIIANAETIRSRLAGPLRTEYADYAGNIASAGQHLNGLLEDLSDLEVVEAQDFSTDREPIDVGDAARRAAGILGVRARAKNIELCVPIKENTHIAVGEFRRVLQILINLIGNAIAYSPKNSNVTIKAATDEEARTVSVTVRDEGPGIDEEQASRIFNKFERLGRDNDGGSGLGLYISYRLAEVMGGSLEIANAGEEGAAFRLTLPLNKAGTKD